MRLEFVGDHELILGGMEQVVAGINADHIMTDPPYLYLKNSDWDRPFDEALFFENAKRMLPDKGFVALFGRGSSFYRWNTMLAGMGFAFKEEIVWNKTRVSGISQGISRMHETISLHTKKNGTVNKNVRLPYVESREYDFDKIVQDIDRIGAAVGNPVSLENLREAVKTKKLRYHKERAGRHHLTFSGNSLQSDPSQTLLLNTERGMLIQSVITMAAPHYGREHPTEKPVALAERVLALISNPGDVVFDPFMGSGSFGVACANTGRKYVGVETNAAYFEVALRRMRDAVSTGEV